MITITKEYIGADVIEAITAMERKGWAVRQLLRSRMAVLGSYNGAWSVIVVFEKSTNDAIMDDSNEW